MLCDPLGHYSVTGAGIGISRKIINIIISAKNQIKQGEESNKGFYKE